MSDYSIDGDFYEDEYWDSYHRFLEEVDRESPYPHENPKVKDTFPHVIPKEQTFPGGGSLKHPIFLTIMKGESL